MNNLTNTILMKVIDLAQTSGAIATIADRLLKLIFLEENATAFPLICPPRPFPSRPLIICGKCVNGFKLCRRCCRLSLRPPQCHYFRVAC
jgi:hypothetical protein